MPAVVRKAGPGAARLALLLRGLADMHAKAGFLKVGAGYEKSDVTPAYLALIHENGVAEKGIPPRPFMRPAVDQHKEEWRERAKGAVKELVEGKGSVAGVFHQVAGLAAEDIKGSISEVWNPPLKPQTIKAKERRQEKSLDKKQARENPAKPLIETATMLDAVTYAVLEGRDPNAE